METTQPNVSDAELKNCRNAMESHAAVISGFGGRLAALYKFVDAALPQLTATQRKEVASCFRQGVEDVMSRTDDIALSAEYHEALLEQTNVLLTALETRSPAPR